MWRFGFCFTDSTFPHALTEYPKDFHTHKQYCQTPTKYKLCLASTVPQTPLGTSTDKNKKRPAQLLTPPSTGLHKHHRQKLGIASELRPQNTPLKDPDCVPEKCQRRILYTEEQHQAIKSLFLEGMTSTGRETESLQEQLMLETGLSAEQIKMISYTYRCNCTEFSIDCNQELASGLFYFQVEHHEYDRSSKLID